MCNIVKKPASALPLFISDLASSRVILNPNQLFKGRTFVISKKHATELSQLRDDERRQFIEEMAYVAEALEKVFNLDKKNYTLLGNVAPHLHWHLIPRYKDDPYWGAPSIINPERSSPTKSTRNASKRFNAISKITDVLASPVHAWHYACYEDRTEG